MKKRILSLIVCFMMVLIGMMAFGSAPVSAASGTALPSDYTGGPLASGTYHISESKGNLTLKSTMTISGNVTLDLNGYVLKGNGKDPVITVNSGTLTIVDSRPNLGHQGTLTGGLWVWPSNGGSLKSIAGGIINNTNNGKYGPGIFVSGGTCIVNDAKIAGCYDASKGAAVTVSSGGTFKMNGGQIIYNKAGTNSDSDAGGAIYGEPSHNNAGSAINLQNTIVSNNTTLGCGGAIWGYNISLNGCTLKDNTASKYGGAIYVTQSNDSKKYGKVDIISTTIDGNTATGGTSPRGGGVYGNSNTTINISGTSKVSNNIADGSGGGAYGHNINITGTASNKVLISNNDSTSTGGGITAVGSCTIEHATIEKNWAGTAGGGVYCNCDATIKNADIINNRAMTTETAGYYGDSKRVDKGRGGGVYIVGSASGGVITKAPQCTLENVNISNNKCMYYGGGLQVGSYATVELISGKINNNEAVLHGAGGVHVTNDATFTLTGGEIAENIAHSVGGGIHSSYSCTLNLDGGAIRDNVTYGRGGGVHVNVGGNLLLKGTNITGNKAYTGTNCYAINVVHNADGTYDVDTSSLKESGSVDGYGGGVVVDSGICTMTAGSLTGNYAQVGGGGIAFIMINSASGNRFGENKVVSFDFNGGSIYNNTTDGNGAGIYLMKNSYTEEKLEKEYGWTIDGNTIKDKDGKEIKLKDASGSPINVQELFEAIPYVNISGGTVEGNIAGVNGGGAYLEENTIFTISSGNVINNDAVNGGGVYVAKGTANINGGTMSENTAIESGGALYINGDVKMTDGRISSNTAKNGGAVYVTGGNYIIEHGIINNNEAKATETAEGTTGGNGGAIYMAGDSNTILRMESGQMNDNKAADDGGAIFATGGTMYIGLEECKGKTKDGFGNIVDENNDLHENKHEDRYHPQINNNEAKDTGGGIAMEGNGIVHFYCGDATENTALYKGVGKNVFMHGGEFFLYDGADVGVPRDPDLVIIGGTLVDQRDPSTNEDVTLKYYKDNTASEDQVFTGLAEKSMYMNLPEGEYFWTAEEGYRFFGWTPKGANSGEADLHVRNKNQYLPSGKAVEIIDAAVNSEGNNQGTYDGVGDNTMHLYALWAPIVSDITYYANINDGEAFEEITPTTGLPVTYEIKEASYSIEISEAGIHKPGYAIKGWYIYQNEDQNANWGLEPEYKILSQKDYSNIDYAKLKENGQYLPTDANNNLALTVDAMTFGDITLIADYQPQYGNLLIDKNYPLNADYTVDGDISFVFSVEGQPDDKALPYVNMEIVVNNDGSKLIEQLPVGTYIVTEIADWSWRYTPMNDETVQQSQEVTITPAGQQVSFTNVRGVPYWLSGDSYKNNLFFKVSKLKQIQ